ncbi:MAG: hypothetical protein COB39_04160 [Marinosulfonomonas sp.]|nr:MAG: hypothetical protein COB39_04160 [Marinosulfonomonas sp.]
MTDKKPRGAKTANKPKAASTEKADTAPKQTVGTLVTKLLADPKLGYDEIIELVKVDFPQAKTSARSVASTASVLRRKGFDIPLRKRSAKAK